MPRIIFLNRFFFPDHSATSQILSDLAFHLARNGRDVHVITSQQRYDDPAAGLPEREVIQDVQVWRVPTTQFGRQALIGRSLDYLSYYRAVRRAVAKIAARGDVLVAMTDPPLLSVLAARAAARHRARLVNWLQDLYPEVAVELGVPLLGGPVAQGLILLRNRSLAAATANVVIGRAMAALVRGLRGPNIRVIHNWADDEIIVPVARSDNPLRRQWGLQDKFVVGYSGNLGRAHDYETVLHAAEQLRDNPHIVFVFIGGGQQFDELARRIRARRLDETIRIFPYQDRELLKYSLSVPDVHWLSLKPELEGLIFPSKFYGIAAAGRPIVAIAAAKGEIAKLVEEYDCGISIEPGEGDRLARFLVEIATDEGRCAEMGRQARAMLDANFSRCYALDLWRAVLDRASRPA